MRVLIHVQSLSGSGHFVRAFEIARALAAHHDVHMVDGGWPVPRRPARVTLVPLPRIRRLHGRLGPLEGDRPIGPILAQRIAEITRAVGALRPDVLLVEHFPFSKWDLADEIRAAIAAARAAMPGGKVICSVRDVAGPTRFDDGPGFATPHRARALEALAGFDALLVHADPRVTRIEEHVPWAAEIPVPVVYTGIVSEKLPPHPAAAVGSGGEEGLVVASAGGGEQGVQMLSVVVAAWRDLEQARAVDGRRLVAFGPLRAAPGDLAALRQRAEGLRVQVEPFDPGFIERLARAELSISRAGYNLCANLLETRRRALLLPDPDMSDQAVRARRLGELGLAEVLEDQRPDACAAAIRRALARPAPDHDLALDGAERTRDLVESLGRVEAPLERR